MKKYRSLLMLTLTGLLTFGAPAISASAAWQNTNAGTIYTQSGSPGYVTGVQKIDNKLYFFNSKGILQKCGQFTVSSTRKTYYADKTTGQLATSKWVGNYYFQADGTMAVNAWIEGKYVGPDGKFTGKTRSYGWVTSSGKTYYYDAKGNKVKGFLTLNGKKYYLNKSTGALVKGAWITVSGKMYYAGPKQGEICVNMWKDKRYLTSTGVAAKGLTKIGDSQYYFNTKTFKYTTGWFKLNGVYYYGNSNGKIVKNSWVSGTYYVDGNGKRVTGLQTIGGKIYYFNKNTAKKTVSTLKAVTSSDSYYFGPDGAALKSKWVKIKNKYYYFQSNGKMAKNALVGSYYVGSDGARTTKTGWVTSGGKKYYLNSKGKKVTGLQTLDGKKYYFDGSGVMAANSWQTVSGKKYYFGNNGVALTGIQTVGSKKYYFTSDGSLSGAINIAFSSIKYTVDANGVVTKETKLSIGGNTTGTKIVNYAVQFVGNKYVYGGNSLTNGTDCSGFTNLIFAHFGIKLLRVADDQMKGPSASYIKSGYAPAVVVPINQIQPGDLLFFGSGNYASHVVIYMGKDQIVHASNSQPYPKGGIKISTLSTYGQKPLKAVRYW